MTRLRRPETQKVAEFLYDLLVANAPSSDYAKRVAERMDLPYPSLARYWQGRAAFPAGLVRPLFLATDQNRRVADFFLLDGTGYRLERDEKGDGDDPADIQRDLLFLSHLEGELGRLYHGATRQDSDQGREISFSEARDLAEALRKLSRLAEDLRQAVKSLHDLS